MFQEEKYEFYQDLAIFALDFSLNHFLYFKNYLESPEKLFKISMVFGGKLDMGESTRN